MVVVAIIAILASILIPNFVNARAQAQTSACESNLRAIATAMELVFSDNQTYLPNAATQAGTAFDAIPANFTGTNGVVYMNNTPKDPAATDQTKNYQVLVTAQNGQPPSYVITCPGVHVSSTLAKLQKFASPGTVCGATCNATAITYSSGIGLAVQ
jgi:type II secretory pathway pseudopilin PulG